MDAVEYKRRLAELDAEKVRLGDEFYAPIIAEFLASLPKPNYSKLARKYGVAAAGLSVNIWRKLNLDHKKFNRMCEDARSKKQAEDDAELAAWLSSRKSREAVTELETPPLDEGGLTIKQFKAIYGLGTTMTYNLIAEGKLVAKKAGKRTLITRDSARAWFNSLPEKNLLWPLDLRSQA